MNNLKEPTTIETPQEAFNRFLGKQSQVDQRYQDLSRIMSKTEAMKAALKEVGEY